MKRLAELGQGDCYPEDQELTMANSGANLELHHCPVLFYPSFLLDPQISLWIVYNNNDANGSNDSDMATVTTAYNRTSTLIIY